jgi:transposase
VFGLGAATRIYLAPGATDLRRGFDGLHGLVRDRLLCDPMFALLLGGIDLAQTRRRRWYRNPVTEESRNSQNPL